VLMVLSLVLLVLLGVVGLRLVGVLLLLLSLLIVILLGLVGVGGGMDSRVDLALEFRSLL